MTQPLSGDDAPWKTRDAASYIADMAADLARLARQHRLDALGYLLDMAQLEARQTSGVEPAARRDAPFN